MKSVIALLAFVACASAGYLGPPAVLHDHHHHHHAVYAAPTIVKSIEPIYAVHPPILAKPVVYHAPAPVVKVLHAPTVVKTVSYGPVVSYGLHDHGHHHHHHGLLLKK